MGQGQNPTSQEREEMEKFVLDQVTWMRMSFPSVKEGSLPDVGLSGEGAILLGSEFPVPRRIQALMWIEPGEGRALQAGWAWVHLRSACGNLGESICLRGRLLVCGAGSVSPENGTRPCRERVYRRVYVLVRAVHLEVSTSEGVCFHGRDGSRQEGWLRLQGGGAGRQGWVRRGARGPPREAGLRLCGSQAQGGQKPLGRGAHGTRKLGRPGLSGEPMWADTGGLRV